MWDQVKLCFQRIVPQHFLSRFAGWMANCEWPWLKNFLIEDFCRRYTVNLDEAMIKGVEGYRSFNDFFTRRLLSDARPLAADPKAIVSPADGMVSQVGEINEGRIVQAKGHSYSVGSLLGESAFAAPFLGGRFLTVYLSPRDYHRVHMPLSGRLKHMVHVPGRLYSVNPMTTNHVDQLFARNERVACVFETERGMMAVVLVGAMIVGSIHTVWGGMMTPSIRNDIQTIHYDPDPQKHTYLEKGDELGHFELGSTVIVLLSEGMGEWSFELEPQDRLKYGERIGRLT